MSGKLIDRICMTHEIPERKLINTFSPNQRKEISVLRLREIALKQHGWFDEAAYVNSRTAIKFRCEEGHEWSIQPQSVLNGTWCRTCWNQKSAGQHLKIDGLKRAFDLAKSRDGECLSTECHSSKDKLAWRCANGHEWFAVLSDVHKGSWCPTCGSGVRERLCRNYFEELTHQSFPKSKPKWLVNSRGNRMELDGYSENLKLAFEHQGEQHYRAVEHFNRRDETLTQRIADDLQKKTLCQQHGVTLIAIPYTVESEKLLDWIVEAISQARPNLTLIKSVSSRNYVPSNELKEFQQIAQSKGGDCISQVYLGVAEKHFFRCAQGHEWSALGSSIRQGSWCPKCKPSAIGDAIRKHTVESMKDLAQKMGGVFLSDKFFSVNEKYTWQCSAGHTWNAAPADVFRGTWCRKCQVQSRRGSIQDAREIAESRGGKCLSKQYENSYSRLTWMCAHGHTWEARFNNVKNAGSWCPICRKKIT